MTDQVEIEQIKEQEDVRAAVRQTAGTKEELPRPIAKRKGKLRNRLEQLNVELERVLFPKSNLR